MSRKVLPTSDELCLSQEKCNKSISSSLAGILRLSFDAEFRRKCFNAMKVDNTADLEFAAKKKLDVLCKVIPGESEPRLGAAAAELDMTTEHPPLLIPADEKEDNESSDTDNQRNSNSPSVDENIEMLEFLADKQCFDWKDHTNLGNKEDEDEILLEDLSWE